jgi:CO/xanthine dehydrogenase Mo-binding subunit
MKGVGEAPLVPVMAAAANAVHNTRGKRFYSLPMSPSLIFASTSPGMERILLKPESV